VSTSINPSNLGVSGQVDMYVDFFCPGMNHGRGVGAGGASSSDPTFTRALPLSFSPSIDSQPFRYQASPTLEAPWGNVRCFYSIAIRSDTNLDQPNYDYLYTVSPTGTTYNTPTSPYRNLSIRMRQRIIRSRGFLW
jgi:hypothetical protein